MQTITNKPAKQFKMGRLILIIFIVILVLCVCSGILTTVLIGGTVKGIFSIAREQSQELMAPFEGYLDAMAQGDLEQAQSYFINGEDNWFASLESLQEELDKNPDFYQESLNLTVQNLSISSGNGRSIGDISGMIEYPGEGYRSFSANLEKDGEVWKLNLVAIHDELYDNAYGNDNLPGWAIPIIDQLYKLFGN